jgi:hypothetical protein
MYVPPDAHPPSTLVVWRRFVDDGSIVAILAAEPMPGHGADYCVAYTLAGEFGCVHVDRAVRLTTNSRRDETEAVRTETRAITNELKAKGLRPLFNLHQVPPYCRDLRVEKINNRRKSDHNT